MEYSKGSEWRRWELHLHTPFTRKEDQFFGETEQGKWDAFYNTIQNYMGDGHDPLRQICTVAITDYLSIENFIQVRNDKRLPACVRLLMPNVELRMQPIAKDSPINIHCIFSPEIADELEDRFFAKLKFRFDETDYGATRSELIRLGRAFSGNPKMTECDAYSIGLMQYVMTSDVLSTLFKNDPRLRANTIIIVSNKSSDGVSGTNAHSDYFIENGSQLDATRQSIYQLSDMIFSANPSDIEYFLGKRVDSIETVKRKCGALMPCVHGCDAHTNDRVFAPVNDRFCWIKADPTFEGFKQILYEPEERVRISSTMPDSKPDYLVIDRVEIVGNDDFDPAPILFNDKLTCIIGGKSTGKSLLLHNMALALDKQQVREKNITASTNVKDIAELRVFWRDGVSSADVGNQRKIVYIPQTYLNRLSDEKEETTEIDSIIQDIVLQDAHASQLHKSMIDRIATHKQNTAKTIIDFMTTLAEQNRAKDEKSEIGDKKGIEAEIGKLTGELEELSKECNITDAEIERYQTAVEQANRISADITMIEHDIEFIEQTTSVLQKRELRIASIQILSGALESVIEDIQTTADSHWMAERKALLDNAEAQKKQLQDSLATNRTIEDELKPKMGGSAQLQKLSSSIIGEKEKLQRISELDDTLADLAVTYQQQVLALAAAFQEIRGYYCTFVDGINQGISMQSDDLEFSANCVFRGEQFTSKLANIFDLRNKSRFAAFDITQVSERDISPISLEKLIETIISKSPTTLQLKGGYNAESALRELLVDWYNIDFIVKMDGDSIQDMSPGKKALVLLRLLISLAESKCPILIDQPEDDLDNRSIFDELIQFIKGKKIDRQIIAVTHNANIVLGGDAELVIVANQRGKNAPNKEFRFEYRGGSIENTFPQIDDSGNIQSGILSQYGIQQHICEILEGGEQAFDLRRNKYHFIRPVQ